MQLADGSWLLEYDSATFASYINTLQRQFFLAQRITTGPGRHIHDWFNAKAAPVLIDASQARVAKRKQVMDNSPEEHDSVRDLGDPANGGVDIEGGLSSYTEDEAALRDIEAHGDMDDDDVMETFATQTEVMPASQRDREADGEQRFDDEDDEQLVDVSDAPAPPIFRPLMFEEDDFLTRSVEKRLRKGHEAVLEEQPKWSLLAKVLKEIEDTIARVSETHAEAPGTNIVLVMCASDRTCLQLRQYLTSMVKTDPPFGPHAGRKMMETLYLSNWQHEQNGARLASGNRLRGAGGDETKGKDDLEVAKRVHESGQTHGEYWKRKNQPSYKRRRMRGGASMPGRKTNAQYEL